MKLEYEFNKFQDMFKKHSLDTTSKSPFLHHYEDDSIFVLLFRNNDGVDIYTVVEKRLIEIFGDSYTDDKDEALDDFRLNYLSNSIEIFNNPIDYQVVNDVVVKSLDPGEDIIDEADNYSDFLGKTFKSWESKVMNAVDKVEFDKTNKTFGEFLSGLMNTVNTLPFMGKIRKYIKQSMMKGIDDAENEVGVQIGFTFEHNEQLKIFEKEQLDGYTLPDGKKWHGIKGATQEMQLKIYKIVDEGVRERKTKNDIKNDIKDVFSKASDSQADRIARTETNRFVSESKITAYKESGVEGLKRWNAVEDNKTSEVCNHLDGKTAEFDEPFDFNGLKYQYPPAHPNCRSVIEFVPKE